MSNLRRRIQVSSEMMENERLIKIKQIARRSDPYEICYYLIQNRNNLSKDDIATLEDAIINTGDIVQIYEFLFLAIDKGIKIDRNRFEDQIIASKNAKLMYYCLIFVPGTNRQKMMQALFDTNNAMYIELLSSDEGKEELGDIREYDFGPDFNYDKKLDEAKKSDYFPSSLEKFRGSKDNIEELKKIVKESKNPNYITELANYLDYLRKYKKIECSLDDLTEEQIKLGDPMNIYEYMSSVPSSVEKYKQQFMDALINSQLKTKENFLEKHKKMDFLSFRSRQKFLKDYIRHYVEGMTDKDFQYIDDRMN